MIELIRTNDPVFLSWLTARLEGEAIAAVVLDNHASVIEGSISAIQRRVMVNEVDLARAQWILDEAERIQAGDSLGDD